MNVSSSLNQSKGLCSVCGSLASLQPGHHDKEAADWYVAQLEWALERSVLLEWICHSCDHLLKTTDQLENELSAALAALQQRYTTLQDLGPSLNHATAGSLPGNGQNSTCPNQADSCSLGPRDVLISIWTEQLSPQHDCQTQDVLAYSDQESGELGRDPSETTRDHSKSMSETLEEEAGAEPEEAGAEPKEAGAEPEEAGAEPEEAGAEPEAAGAEPEAAGAEPEEAGAEPEAAGAEPEEAGAEPEAAGAEPEESSRGLPARKRRRKMTVRLSCDDCSRTFGTVSTLARHRRRAHRGGTGSGNCGAEDSRCGEKSAELHQQDPATEGGDRMKASGDIEKRGDARQTEVEHGQLMTLVDLKETAVAEVSAAGHTVNHSTHTNDTDFVPVVFHTSATGATESQGASTGVTESHTIASDGLGSVRYVTSPASVDAAYTEPSVLYSVNKEPSWVQTDFLGVDPSTTECRSITLCRPAPVASYSPVPSVVFAGSADMADGQMLPQSHSDTASESIGNTGTILGHAEFPNLAIELSTEIPATETMEVSFASVTNEGLNIAPDINQELSISLDTEVELSHTAATNAQQKSCPTSVINIIQNDVTESATDRSCAVDPKTRPLFIHQKVAKETIPETEKRSVTKSNSSSSKVEKKAVPGTRRPRLTLYQRQGQKWRCLECSALFASRAGAHGHALIHSEPDGGRCPRCAKPTPTRTPCVDTAPAACPARPPSCPVCGKIVADAAYLAQHVLSHSKDAPKKHQCDRCGLAFAVGARLRAHIAIEHSGERPYRCDICRREFKLQVQLQRHLRSVHAAVPVVTCEVCGKGFNRADHLRAHMAVHTGARPFVCGECGRGFTRADTLAEHARLHTGEKPFKCDECGEAFREQRGYKRHIKTKHGEGDKASGLVAAS